jgi:primosomal protein N''
MEHNPQSERLARLESKMDSFANLQSDLKELRESINQLSTCVMSMSKEMTFVRDRVLADLKAVEQAQDKTNIKVEAVVSEFERDLDKVREKLDAINVKIIGWSAAGSAIFLLIGTKITKLLGLG